MRHALARRLGAAALSGALAATTFSSSSATVASSAVVEYDAAPVAHGAAWLERQLTDGLIHNEQFNFDDLGLSADAALALDAIGGQDTTVAEIVAAIEPNAESGWYSFTFNGVTTTFGGSVAKALVVAQIAGSDPTDFGGVNLVTRLEGLVAATPPIAGRVQDENNDFGDTNVIGQAFAARGLDAAGSAKAGDVLTFLLQQQCAAGYFRLDFAAKDAPDQTCDSGIASGDSAPDTDVTALAVLQLLATGPTDLSPAAVAVDKAVAWLLDAQAGNGSFGGGTSTEGANTNSSGLAAWALGAAGEVDAAARAASWVRRHQSFGGSPCTPGLRRQRGAIAYDASAFGTGADAGIPVENQDQWRRATAQALPALEYAPASAQGYALRGTSSFVKARTDVAWRVTGLAVGERACVSGPKAGSGSLAKLLRGTGSTIAGSVTVPASTAPRTYQLKSSSGTDTLTFRVLGALTIPFSLVRDRVAPGGTQRVAVRGLEEGEMVVVRVRGEVVDKGRADADGRFVSSFRVTRPTGPATVKVTGQFPDIRRNSKTFRVG